MLKKLEVALVDMQRDQAGAMLTFEQRHWAALLANEQRVMEKVEEGNVQVVAALALKLDTVQVRGCGAPCSLSFLWLLANLRRRACAIYTSLMC